MCNFDGIDADQTVKLGVHILRFDKGFEEKFLVLHKSEF